MTSTPWTPSPRREDYTWMSRREWEQRCEKLKQDPARVGAHLVFMGDSITQAWTELVPDLWRTAFAHFRPLCLGIGGDRTEHLLWRLEKGELAGLNPRVLVLLIGINNLNAGDSAADCARGIQAVVQRIHKALPSMRILLLGLLPSGAAADDPLRDRIQRVNRTLAAWPHENLYYRDMGQCFLLADGTIEPRLMPDGLHPSVDGYHCLAKVLRPHLEALSRADVVDVGAIE